MEISDCSSSVDSSAISIASQESRTNLNLKATELRLGLPGSQSPERDVELGCSSSPLPGQKILFPLQPLTDDTSCLSSKNVVSSNKRSFSVAMSGFSEGNLISNPDANALLSTRPGPLRESPADLNSKIEATPTISIQERPLVVGENIGLRMAASSHGEAPAPKAQVVGWPPVRSYRKNSFVSVSKNMSNVHGKAGPGGLFVKVSMDGAPYLRKVDLKAYSSYNDLSPALEKMFSCFTISQNASTVTSGGDMLSESKLKDLVHSSEYALTYQDKDGDWMLVGDVPWEMFIETCRRLRIMKSSDAIGLAPRAMRKTRSGAEIQSHY